MPVLSLAGCYIGNAGTCNLRPRDLKTDRVEHAALATLCADLP